MLTKEDIEHLKPFQARAIIEGLRKGLVPTEYVAFFTVGRFNWLKAIEDDFEHFIAEGGSKVRFINGDYGDGKTHFMSVVRQLALQRKFAASFVVLTKDIPIHKFELVYQEIVLQLRGSFPGSGIRACVEAWMDSLRAESIDLQTLSDMLKEAQLDSNFIHALEALYVQPTHVKENLETIPLRELLYQWLEGKKVSKKDLSKVKVFESLHKSNGKIFLQSLVKFLRCIGHKGLILFFDELETVLSQSASVRAAAYENLRLLMDNTEHTEHLEMFFSLIPDVLLAEKGFKSYDALWSRVRSVGDSEVLNYRSTLIDLYRSPLNQEELIELGLSLRRIYEISYRWNGNDVVSKELIIKMCRKQEEMGILREVRLFIKQMIRFLDLAEQGFGVDSIDLGENLLISQKESTVEKEMQLEPLWDE